MTVLGEAPARGARTFRELFRPHAGKVAIGIVWLVLSNALLLAVPSLVNEGVSLVERGTQTGAGSGILRVFGVTSAGVGTLVGAIVACAIAGAVVRVLSRVVLFNVGRDVERELRSELFAHASTLSPTWYRKGSVGDLMSRMTNDMTNVRLMAGFALVNALNSVITLVASLPLMLALDVVAAGLALLPFPLVMLLGQVLSRTMFQRTRENQEALGKLTAAVQENLAGQQVVRAFSRERGESRRFAGAVERVYATAMRLAAVRLLMFPLIGIMVGGAIGVAIYAGGRAIVAGRLDIGDVVELNFRLVQLAWPAMAMGFIISVYQRGKASLSRINDVLTVRPDIVDGPVERAVIGRVEARGLAVEVAPGRLGLADFHALLEPGHVLGVVGRNGSGKSTLLRALARQVPCARGQLFVDDVDVNDWHLRALHRGIGVVPEDGFLFSASLRDNLAFGRMDASDEEIERVIDLIDLRRDVTGFPEGVRTMVGERGVTLSGGQRQRVALGRAILARPSVLLLDDSLSAVDAETEARIVQSLRSRSLSGDGPPPSMLIVSHRLSAVRGADEIVALADGQVVERGTHDALLARGGLYADLWGKEQLRRALETAGAA